MIFLKTLLKGILQEVFKKNFEEIVYFQNVVSRQNFVSKQNFARWQAILSVFHFDIEYIKGTTNSIPDFLTCKLSTKKMSSP